MYITYGLPTFLQNPDTRNMKRQLKILIALTFALFSFCISTHAQLVGDTPYKTSDAKAKTQNGVTGFFTIKVGLTTPSGFNKKAPLIPEDVKNGNVAMKNGLFAETGYGMLIGKKNVGFYFYPFLVAGYMSSHNFSSLKNSETMPFVVVEIAERYGIFYRPAYKLVIAAYYRPAAVVPYGFDTGNISGQLKLNSDLSFIKMSNTAGISVQYRFISISCEYYYAKPSLSVKQDGTDTTTQYKIPVRLNIISLAFVL